jgi:hypothetical protein
MPDFVSFNEFIDRTDAAKAVHHFEAVLSGRLSAARTARRAKRGAAAPLSKEEFEAEFDKMKKYLLRRYDGVRCDHTFLDFNGNFVDCVPFEQQPSVRTVLQAGYQVAEKAPEPSALQARRSSDPMKRPPVPTPLVPPLRRGLVDPFGRPIACPEGSVPLRRVTLSQMAWHGKFERFFDKYPVSTTPAVAAKGKRKPTAKSSAKKKTAGRRAAVPPQAGGHRYAICQDTHGGPYFGCTHGLNLWKPNPSPGVFSLSQLWIAGSRQPNGLPETVESGWIVYPSYPGGGVGDNPVLFVYFNPDGYGGLSGYVENQNLHGFVRFNSGWVLMSGGLTNLSTPGRATQTGLQMLWELKDGDQPPQTRGWYLYVGQDAEHWEKVGYFPSFLYTNGVLGEEGANVQFGGEVAPFGGSAATGQMGSGVPPRQNPQDSYGEVAFQYEMYVQKQEGQDMVEASLKLVNTGDEPFYGGSLSDDDTWRSYFFFGGAGAP